jgi:hypothetical protein
MEFPGRDYNVRELDHLAPFFGFVCDELSEVGGRARQQRAAQIGKPRPMISMGVFLGAPTPNHRLDS